MKGAKQNVVSGWWQHRCGSLEENYWNVSRFPSGTVLMQFSRQHFPHRFVGSKLVGRKTCCGDFEAFRPSEQCLVTSRLESQTLCTVKLPRNNSSRPLTSYERDCRRSLPGIPVQEAGRGVLSTINVAVLSWPERSSASEVINISEEAKTKTGNSWRPASPSHAVRFEWWWIAHSSSSIFFY